MPFLKSKDWLGDIHRIANPRQSRHGAIRLDKSERVTPYPAGFFSDFLATLEEEDLSAYPEVGHLVERIARFHDVAEEWVVIGAGMDAIIKRFFECFIDPGDTVIISEPCFPMYRIYAQLFAADVRRIGYDANGRFDFDKLVSVIDDKVSLVQLANPNSPIGDWYDQDMIVALVEKAHRHNVAVMFDEAYVEFAPASVIDLVGQYENLAVARTFSKAMGGAGVRLAYVLAQPPMTGVLGKWRPLYEANQIAVKFGLFLLDRHEVVSTYAREVVEARDALGERAHAAGFDFVSSHTNYIHMHAGAYQDAALKEFDRAGALYKTTGLPWDSRRDWLRLSLSPGLDRSPMIDAIFHLMDR